MTKLYENHVFASVIDIFRLVQKATRKIAILKKICNKEYQPIIIKKISLFRISYLPVPTFD